MSQNLNLVLKGIISSLPSLGVDNNYLLDSKGKIVKITGKDVRLWNDELYQSPADAFFVFNPFQELTTHEDSPSLSYLKKMINIELNRTLLLAIPAIIKASIDIKTPNKRQSKILDGINIDKGGEKLVAFLDRLSKVVKLNSRNRSIIDIVLYNNHPTTREADGCKYAGAKSPLVQELAYWTSGNKIFDITGSTKSIVETLRIIISKLLPEDSEPGIYFVGNKHSTIPRNKALHDIYSDIIDSINGVLTTLKITDINVPTIDDGWTDGMSSVASYMSSIPRDIYGTIGKVRAGKSSEEVPTRRLAITEGFGAGGVAAAGIRPQVTGGILAQLNKPQNTAIPPGYALVQVGPNGGLFNNNVSMGNLPMFGGQSGNVGNCISPRPPQGGLLAAVYNA